MCFQTQHEPFTVTQTHTHTQRERDTQIKNILYVCISNDSNDKQIHRDEVNTEVEKEKKRIEEANVEIQTEQKKSKRIERNLNEMEIQLSKLNSSLKKTQELLVFGILYF